jgi:hypothetical protein
VADKEEKPLPGCKAILLCEGTTVEAGTGKVSLIGLIRTLIIAEFPALSERMKLFLQLVDGIGEYGLTIEVHDLAEGRVIARLKGPRISFLSRPATHQLFLTMPALPIPHSGKYDVIVLGNGAEIDRQQFRARIPREEGEANET